MERRSPLVASPGVSSAIAAPERAGSGDPAPATPSPKLTGQVALAVCLAAALVALAFVTGGGVDQTVATPGNTWSNIVVTLLGAAAVCAAIVVRRPGRRWGAVTVALMAALTALEALSIVWSVLPDSSWLAANQMLAYLATFAGAAALARLAPRRWPALVGAIALTMTALAGWALLVKVFPATLASGNTYGRLLAPYGYWNAVGLSAALGLPCCLWLGARRSARRGDAGRRLAGLAAPAIGVLISVIVLSYSRSADLAAAVVVGLWLAFVPLRLRALVMLAIGGAGAGAISGWALAHHALSSDNIAMGAQDGAGHTFGVVALVVIVLVTAAGLVAARAMDRVDVAPALRRRIGTALIVLVALVPVAAVGGLAASSRGLTGEISHGWHQLTSSTGTTNSAGRVLQFGSSRPVYWHEGISVGDHNLFKGVGELGFSTARLRYTTNTSLVQQAHSYVFETFADLGLLGLAISAALLIAWLVASARALALRTRWRALAPGQAAERAGLASLGALVVGFGVQSTLDWTWYFAGVSVPVLLCAGWLAGRGPLVAAGAVDGLEPAARRKPGRTLLDRPGAAAAATGLAALALLGAWFQWQPLRSDNQVNDALNAGSSTRVFSAAQAAANSDPLSLAPHDLLSSLYLQLHDTAQARAQLARATQLQPQNPQTWSALGGFDLTHGDPARAIPSLYRVLALDQVPDTTRVSAGVEINQAQAAIARAAAARAAIARAAAAKPAKP